MRKEDDPPPPPPSAPPPVQLAPATILREGAAKRAHAFLDKYFNEADGVILKSDGVKQLEVHSLSALHKLPSPETGFICAALVCSQQLLEGMNERKW